MLFNPQERLILKYHDGEREVHGDPLAIELSLRLILGNADAVIDAADAGDAQAESALYQAIRQAFEMKPFDRQTGAGATNEMCDAALQALWDCLESKKKSADSSLTSCPPTTSSPDLSATGNTSG